MKIVGGANRHFRGTHRKSTCQRNIHISIHFHWITKKYFDNRCRNYNVLFQIQCHILLWFSSIPTVDICAHTRTRIWQFHGSAPAGRASWQNAAPPLCSPLHWECISRRDKHLLCKKPFMTPVAELCTCLGPAQFGWNGWKWMYCVGHGYINSAGWLRVLRLRVRLLRCWICYSGVNWNR